MKWFRKRSDVGDTGGKEAREQAEKDYAETVAETERVKELARDLLEIRENNHLAEAFMLAVKRQALLGRGRS